MAKPYKLIPIDLALLIKEHFEDNLSKFIKNKRLDDDEKLLLVQITFRRVIRH